MDENIKNLEESLLQYEQQLQQVTEAISTDSESLEELISLRENLVELITLTKENLESVKAEDEDPLAKEYELFKAELECEHTNENEETDSIQTIQDELSYLIGKKCQAPFCEQWSEIESSTYHNALIMNINASDSLDNILVKVMFVNPTCKEMLPCQYFLDGECKFSDENCHFSHGYVVNFADLREYKEPDFNVLKENLSILVKDVDGIWKRAIITALILEENKCSVKFESGRAVERLVDIHDTLPLIDNANEDTDIAEFTPQIEDNEKKEIDFEEGQSTIEDRLLQPPPVKLGEWEKYTKNIGSKLMANMGYVVGTGLGKYGEGRVEPVSAVVLPPGKSLDHCMALREAAGGDPNLFSVNKLQKEVRKRVSAKNHKVIVKPKKSKDIFSFINESLLGSSMKVSKVETDEGILKQSSNQALNVEELRISETIQKKNYEIMVLRERLSRQKANTVGCNELTKKVRQAEDDLSGMQCKLKNIHKEQSYRQTMKQLTEF